MTGLMGRWQKINSSPLVICDTGHNLAGWEYLSKQIALTTKSHGHLHIVFGMVDDKDIVSVLNLLPVEASYYFTQASTHRAIPVERLCNIALNCGLHGSGYNSVKDAYAAALINANANDFIFVGGSSYVVADLMEALKNN